MNAQIHRIGVADNDLDSPDRTDSAIPFNSIGDA
jgi:hypothetical protein